MNEPRNPQDALRQARVKERAERLYADGYTVRQLDEYGTYRVTSDEGMQYEVSTLWETCDCPFFRAHGHRTPCKHLLGLPKLLADQEAHDAATIEAYERETFARLYIEEARIEASLR